MVYQFNFITFATYYLYERMSFESILNQIVKSIDNFADQPAFCIGDVNTSYSEFGKTVASVQKCLEQSSNLGDNIGVVLQDDFRTYAAMVALWLEGKAYVPINPFLPIDRNVSIIQQSEISTLLNSGNSMLQELTPFVNILEIDIAQDDAEATIATVKKIDESVVAYILFTSGSTGVPKGVPITRSNVASFMAGVDKMGMHFSHEDKFLQMFDLTFDLSVWSFLQPLCVGASQYPIPHGEIKYMYAYELLEEQEITVALLVPSVLNFLRPYFEDLNFPSLKYSLFCGEALYAEIAKEWLEIVPNARVFNVYGPTEATIFCSQYELKREIDIESENGIVTIGEPLLNTQLIVIDENNQQTKPNQRGELCLGGGQITPGYVQNESLNRSAFVTVNGSRFYRSGDICFYNSQGSLMYVGRLDSQIKIQGFRVELSEIEHQARLVCELSNVAVVAIADEKGLHEIHLFVENTSLDLSLVISKLKGLLPIYMVPKAIHPIAKFPLNANGKTDRKALKAMLSVPNITIRRAQAKDVDFLVEAIVHAEKSGTERLSYQTIFNLEESEVREILKSMILENEGYCELSFDSFLIAEINGTPVSAVAAWIEGEDDIPSAIVKANLLFSFMPPAALENLRSVSSILEDVHIPRINGALQLESIYTVADFRGKGIVKFLIEQHIKEAKAKNSEVNLAQIILSDVNDSALKAYTKADFKLTLHKISKNPQIQEILPSSGNFSLEKTI